MAKQSDPVDGTAKTVFADMKGMTKTGLDGLPYLVDPDGDTIYSGMTKRSARVDGEFVRMGQKKTR